MWMIYVEVHWHFCWIHSQHQRGWQLTWNQLNSKRSKSYFFNFCEVGTQKSAYHLAHQGSIQCSNGGEKNIINKVNRWRCRFITFDRILLIHALAKTRLDSAQWIRIARLPPFKQVVTVEESVSDAVTPIEIATEQCFLCLLTHSTSSTQLTVTGSFTCGFAYSFSKLFLYSPSMSFGAIRFQCNTGRWV